MISIHRSRHLTFVLVPLTGMLLMPWQRAHGQAAPPLDLSPTTTPAFGTVPTVGDKKITGVVLDEKNAPVAGMTVSLDWRGSQKLKTGRTQIIEQSVPPVNTDAEGKFAFSGMREGDYTYFIGSQATDYVDVQDVFALSKTDVQKDLRIVVSKGSLVSGRVVDGLTGKPLSGIFVVAGSIPAGGNLAKWDEWQVAATALTDAQGRYQVRILPGDSFVGVGRSDNGTVLSKRVCESVQRLTSVLGQTAAAPDVSVSLHPIIVFLGPDGKPISNAQVRIIPDDLGRGGYILSDSTRDEGTLVLDRFDSGSFQVHYGEMFASGAYHCPPGEPLTVTVNSHTAAYPSGTATVHLAEGSAGVIMGTVVSESGKPIPQARVHISEVFRPANSQGDYGVGDFQFTTDKSGVFRAPLDPAGRYFIMVRADGFNQVQVSDLPLTVTKGAAVSAGIVHLVRAQGFVAGKVVDKSGQPIAGVLVYVQGGKTNISACVTDDTGHFHIPNVVVGDVVHLKLCLKGEAPDSGEALSQSNEEMDFPDVTAGVEEREIVWNPHS